MHCLKCVSLCPQHCHSISQSKHAFERTNCIACGKCVSAHCENLEVFGNDVSVDEIILEVLKDKKFYANSGGGITLSGGEPFYQAEFCLELLKQAKAHDLHVCMETCGFASKEIIEKSAEFVDVYLFDYKETNPQNHKAYTGVDNHLILENLYLLDNLGKSIIIRCPIIPGYNDTDEHFNGISSLANQLKNVVQIEIEPYHSLGAHKYAKLNREYTLSNIALPSNETIDLWIEKIQKQTKVKVLKA